MSLEQEIMTQLKAAMLAKDEAALRSLRAIKAAILLAKTAEGATGEMSSEAEIKLLQKMVKQRKDSLEIFQQQMTMDSKQKPMNSKLVRHRSCDDCEYSPKARM